MYRMAPPRDPNPSPEALRKRAARAKAKAANPELYAAKLKAASQRARDKKKCEEKVEAARTERPPPPTARPPAGPVYTPNELAELVAKRSAQVDRDPITESTAKRYAERLKRLQALHDGDNGPIDLRTFSDVEGTWRTVTEAPAQGGPNQGKPRALATQLADISALVGALKRVEGFEDLAATFAALAAPLQLAYDEQRKQNRFAPGERAKFVPWPQLVQTFEREAAKSKSELRPRDLALLGLYTAIPPRRVDDFRRMRLARPGRKLDAGANWLVLDGEGRPTKLVFNVFKTAGRLGPYSRDSLPKPLAAALRAHLRANRVRDGAPLFPAAGGDFYAPNAFSALVGDVFEKATGRRATVNALRHSAVTHFLSTRRSVAQKEKFARQLGHSVATQSLYDRLDSSEDEAPPGLA